MRALEVAGAGASRGTDARDSRAVRDAGDIGRLMRCAHVSRCSGGVDCVPLDDVVKLLPIGCHSSVGGLEESKALIVTRQRGGNARAEFLGGVCRPK